MHLICADVLLRVQGSGQGWFHHSVFFNVFSQGCSHAQGEAFRGWKSWLGGESLDGSSLSSIRFESYSLGHWCLGRSEFGKARFLLSALWTKGRELGGIASKVKSWLQVLPEVLPPLVPILLGVVRRKTATAIGGNGGDQSSS